MATHDDTSGGDDMRSHSRPHNKKNKGDESGQWHVVIATEGQACANLEHHTFESGAQVESFLEERGPGLDEDCVRVFQGVCHAFSIRAFTQYAVNLHTPTPKV